jgi:GT2 family glycosyltransferase
MKGTFRWRVLELDLAADLPRLEVAPGYSGVRVIYRFSNRVIGHTDFTTSQLPLSPTQLATAAAHAIAPAVGDQLLEEGLRSALPGMAEPGLNDPARAFARLLNQRQALAAFQISTDVCPSGWLPSVTVAVCTCNRPTELERCLQSFRRLRERPKEILVVDNAPEGNAAGDVLKRFPEVRYIPEPVRGLSTARNTALAGARGEIVAFADDDVIVDPEWVGRIRRAFQDSRTMVVTGLILPAELETRAQIIFEKNLAWFHQGYRIRKFDPPWFESVKNKGVQSWCIGAGANMAVRRIAYDVGFKFDTRLGPGVFGGCGEDSEYWYRLISAGWQCVYDPSAIAWHHHRKDLNTLRQQIRQYMKGHVASLILQFRNDGSRGNLHRLLIGLPLSYVMVLLRTIAGGFALEDLLEFNGLLGAISGLTFLFARGEETP